MEWLFLMLAGISEVFGVLFLNKLSRSKKWWDGLLLLVTFTFSFLLLSKSMETITMGTAYAVWTGIGTVGGTLVGILFYGESKDVKRLFCIGVILASVIGLKLIS
ncbi:multidrug efflux SMR transporter [Bacillus gobiensis]|uniref:DMT family transporter n=1 Tax=Bacillus gobiensis TaxID=1441095 RepID=UPI003D1B1171